MGFIEELRAKGLIYQISDEIGVEALPEGAPFYLGFDPTSPYLHMGHLVPLIAAIRLAESQKHLSPIILFGGATGAVGDPTGRSTDRPDLSREEINSNVVRHKEIVSEILSRVGVEATYVNNYEWTQNLSLLEFLRDFGKSLTVNYMLAKDSVKNRLEGGGLTFTEMSYMLLQGMDFYHLNKTAGCRLQIGGSDQFGNMTAGLELIRKKGLPESYVISFPLITDSTGKKFGKSSGGALWLNREVTSPYKFHQYWLNLPDADMSRYLRYFSRRSLAEIELLEVQGSEAPEKRIPQKALADEMCDLVHGTEATQEAQRCAEALFSGAIKDLSARSLAEVFADAPSTSFEKDELLKLPLLDIFTRTGLTKSKGEARRLLGDGGGYVNNDRVNEPNATLSSEQLLHGEFVVIRAGKKSYHLIRVP